MTDKVHYVTAVGLEKLKAELHDLKTVKRHETAERVDAARSLGDLSENAEYQEAKQQLSWIEGRVLQLQEMLKNVSVIEEERGASGVVNIGSTVTVESGGKKKDFQIVGSNEADPAAGRISNESPIGSSFLGHKKGDAVSVATPGGTTTYTIAEVK